MATQIKIACTSCAQHLLVDAASAGKQVRCPKCQALLVIPKTAAGKTAATKPAKNAGHAGTTDSATKVVGCPNCQTRLSVQVLATAAVAKCPKCQTQIQIPAASRTPSADSSPKPPRQKPATSAANTRAASSTAESAVTRDGFPEFGQMEIPAPTPGRSLGTRPAKRAKVQGTNVLAWINSHRLITTMALLNIIALLTCIWFPAALLISAIYLPVGLAICGLLFVPRQHLVQKTWDRMGLQITSVGGGFGVVLLVVALKFIRVTGKASKNENLDFSGFTNPANLAAFAFSIFALIAMVTLFVYLWRSFGLARVLAVMYCFSLSIMVFSTYRASQKRRWLDENFGSSATRRSAQSPITADEMNHLSPKDFARRAGFEPRSNDPAQSSTDFAGADRFATSPQATPPQATPPQATPPQATTPNGSQSPSGFNPTFTPMPEGRPGRANSNPTNNALEPTLKRSVKRRPITLPVPQDSVRVDSSMPLVSGIKLRACYSGRWYLVTVKEVHDDGTVLVNWDDFPSFTYDMTREDLVISRSTLAKIGS